MGPVEDDRRRTELHRGVGRPRQRPRRQRRRAGQPRHAVRGCVPAGRLALEERRLHVGAGLRDAGSGREHRARGVRPRDDAGGHTRIYVGDGGTEIDGQFPPHSNTGVYRADSIDTKTAAQRPTAPPTRGTPRSRPEPRRAGRRTTTARPSAGTTTRRLTRRPPRQRLRRRLVRLQPVREHHRQRQGRAALAGCGRDLERPDTDNIVDHRDPPRPACAGRRSRKSAALLRGRGRRRRPFERPTDQRDGELQPEPRAVHDDLPEPAQGRPDQVTRSTRASRRCSTRAWR